MLALILAASLSSASTPVVNSDGDIPGKTVSDQSCDNAHDKSCLEIINDGANALQIGTSFVGPAGSDGIDNALVKVRGLPQCVFTTGPNGTRCVSVLGPGEHGWVNFPSARMVTITVTWWEMDGLETKHQSSIPGTVIPAIAIGDEKLISLGSLATKGDVKVIPKDLTVAGNNILHVKY